MRYPVVFFDLDGTLTDSSEGITKSVQYALAKLGIEAELDGLSAFVGPPLHHSFAAAYDFDEETIQRAVTYYREYFVDRGMFENRVFDGVPQLLRGLREGGRSLRVVTSKPTVYSERIVEHFGLDVYFDGVVGSELDLSNTDKPTLVRLAMERHTGRDAADFVMIGDREHDVHGAHANEIDSIGVTYGAGSREELVAASATHVVDTLSELETLL